MKFHTISIIAISVLASSPTGTAELFGSNNKMVDTTGALDKADKGGKPAWSKLYEDPTDGGNDCPCFSEQDVSDSIAFFKMIGVSAVCHFNFETERIIRLFATGLDNDEESFRPRRLILTSPKSCYGPKTRLIQDPTGSGFQSDDRTEYLTSPKEADACHRVLTKALVKEEIDCECIDQFGVPVDPCPTKLTNAPAIPTCPIDPNETDRTCFLSHEGYLNNENYPQAYDCVIPFEADGVLDVVEFDVEGRPYDFLTVKGVPYEYSSDLQGLEVNAGEAALFVSDDYYTKDGFKICIEPNVE